MYGYNTDTELKKTYQSGYQDGADAVLETLLEKVEQLPCEEKAIVTKIAKMLCEKYPSNMFEENEE